MSQEDLLDVDRQADVEALQTPAIVDAPEDAAPAPEAAPFSLRAWAARLESRLVALEGLAHTGHTLDDSAIEEIVARVMARIESHLTL